MATDVRKLMLTGVIKTLSDEDQAYVMERADEFKKEFDDNTLTMTAASLAMIEWDEEHEN